MADLATAIRTARVYDLSAGLVKSCLRDDAGDQLFQRAWTGGLATLTRHERAVLAPVTGHVAESVAELLLDEAGYHIVWHWAGPGGHGIDLLVLNGDGDFLVAVEVKGTFRSARWPRPSRGRLAQFSTAWMDSSQNTGMAQWQLSSADLYGMLLLINFADRRYRVLLTDDFDNWRPGNERFR